MTDWTVTGQRSLLSIFFAYANTWLRKSGSQAVSVLRILFRFVLVLLALVAFTLAAWMVAVPLGLVVGGCGLLVIEWMVKR